MNELTLCTLYEIASRKPGWLSQLQAVMELTPEEVGFLEWLDSQEHQINKKVRELECQMRRDGFREELVDCETDEERMAKINRLVFSIEDAHSDMVRLDKSYFERSIHLFLHRYEHWVALRKKIRGRMIYANRPTQDGMTEADIERARQVPLESVVEPLRGYITCLWHEDKSPSMWVKGGFGWCFSCNAWCDSIKWWMKKNGRTFPETVYTLNRL